MNERAPQHVQNIVIRYFCQKHFLHYTLSASEYKMKNCSVILESLISKIKNIDGIVVYSLFQLPENISKRNKILNKIIKEKSLLVLLLRIFLLTK